jgi:hypothetical protein
MKVFLGGTCNGSTWRDVFIPMLIVDSFNPVVKDWTPECMAEELKQREECDICLYVITPKMVGTYSIAEVVDDSNKRPQKTVFVRLEKDGDNNEYSFSFAQWKSLGQVSALVKGNGAMVFDNLKSAADYINLFSFTL